MPSAARAALLRVLADAAASPGPAPGTSSAWEASLTAVGQQAVAVAFEYQRYVSATPSDGCLGSESVSVSSSGAEVVTCGGSAAASSPASGGTPSGATSRAAPPA